MFKRKLVALNYHSPDEFNCNSKLIVTFFLIQNFKMDFLQFKMKMNLEIL